MKATVPSVAKNPGLPIKELISGDGLHLPEDIISALPFSCFPNGDLLRIIKQRRRRLNLAGHGRTRKIGW